MLTQIALAAAVFTAAPKVGPMTLAEMVRFSDVVVVATVESVSKAPVKNGVKVEHAHPGETARLGTLRVERWVKGQPTDEPLVFLNQSTWICDMTGADAGERALFFLVGGSTKDGLQDGIIGYVEKFGDRHLLRVVHSGRGQMGLRRVAGEELATCWTGDVILPEGAPRRPGPDPEYSFIESVPLDWLATKIPAIAAAQHMPQLRLDASQGVLPGLPWTLTLRHDRTAQLVVGHPGGAVSNEFVIGADTAWTIDQELEDAGNFQAVSDLGVPRYGVWDRRFVVAMPEGGHSVRLGDLTKAEQRKPARAAARIWTMLRDAIEVPEAVDHRAGDAKVVE